MPESRESHSAARRNQFGTFGGVFTPSILTILGVIMFMRAGFVTGEAGILLALAILLIAKSITILTSLSISAISTNMPVRGGGAYFMISRVLGPESGGAIGIALFLAQALAAPFYILGFTEALTRTFPSATPYFLWINLTAATVLLVVSYISASLAIRTQYIIMTALAVSIVVFAGGLALRFRTDTFMENLLPPAVHTEIGGRRITQIETPDASAPADEVPAGAAHDRPSTPVSHYTFWILFAIYFPAVTGIDAGLNMSGDLKNPIRSIPVGTLCAVGLGLLVYGGQIILMGGAFERTELIERPFELLRENALYGAGFLVSAGVFAATLSSALGSFLGAPRILQAVARDKILSPLRPFAMGTHRGDEPRRASILTGVVSLSVLLYAGNDSGGAALNAVAAIITMFFLYSYGMINLAAFTEAFGGNPSFRPRFRYFHWATALAGAATCVIACLMVDPLFALVSALLVAGLYVFIRTRKLEAAYGDARRGFVYNAARTNLVRLARMEEDPKNWRPTILAFTGNPNSRETLVSYAVWLGSGRGIVYLANILIGDYEQYIDRRQTAIRQLHDFCRKNDIQAFPTVVVAGSLDTGISIMLQSTAVGPIRPNMVLFGWSDDANRIAPLLQMLYTASKMGMSLLLIRPGTGDAPEPRSRRRVDVWWRGRENGELMILLAHLLTQNWEWSNMDVRLLRVVENEAGLEPARKALADLIEEERLDATAVAIVSDASFAEVLHEHSCDAACVFLGFGLPEHGAESAWHGELQAATDGMPTVVMIRAANASTPTA